MKTNENKDGKRKGLIATIAVHACLLLLMFILGFTYMVPPKGDVAIGFEALGQEDAGKTTEAATSEQTSPQQQDATSPPEETQSAQSQDDFATQDDSPVDVSQNSQQNTSNQTTPKVDNTKPQETKPDPDKEVDDKLKDLMNSMNGPDKTGGSGNNNKDGNQGGEKGTIDGDGEGGTGVDGMFDFGGRKAIKPGNLNHDCGVSGRVKVRVKVDRKGYVIEAEAIGGTTSVDCLRKKAVKEAKATKYSENPTGPVYQEGVIELYFQLK